MADDTEGREPAENFEQTLRRHGDADPSEWVEAPAVTGRPADVPTANSTLAERAKARAKQVDAAENKAVASSATKRPAKKAAKKS